jgi:hypothetical protein
VKVRPAWLAVTMLILEAVIALWILGALRPL